MSATIHDHPRLAARTVCESCEREPQAYSAVFRTVDGGTVAFRVCLWCKPVPEEGEIIAVIALKAAGNPS